MEPRKPAPRQGCKLSVTTTATNNHKHLAPLTGCGCDATPFYTPATPDGAAGNPSRVARDKPVALAPAAVQVAASVKLRGASPRHLSKLLTRSPSPWHRQSASNLRQQPNVNLDGCRPVAS